MVKGCPQSKGNSIDIWTLQCNKCLKWRAMDSQEEYEQFRLKLRQEPFYCKKKAGLTCNDPPELVYDNSRTWVIDKPNLPATPANFKRRLVLRKDLSRLDIYYDAPDGQNLRSLGDVARFLEANPHYKRDISINDFSFSSPKVANTIATKMSSSARLLNM